MTKQQEIDRGYPQADPAAKSPPRYVVWLALVIVSLGLIAGIVILGPALQFFQAD